MEAQTSPEALGISPTPQEQAWLALLGDIERTTESLLTQRQHELHEVWAAPDLGAIPPRLVPRVRAALTLLAAAAETLENQRADVAREIAELGRAERRRPNRSTVPSVTGANINRLA